MKDIISKLQITKNHRILEVLENSKVVYDFLQNELHDGNVILGKVISTICKKSNQKQHVER